MDIKLSILLFLTTLAGVLQENGSSAAATKNEETSKKLQLAQDTPLANLPKVAELINGEIRAILSDKSEGRPLNSKETKSRAAAAEKNSLEAYLSGITPTVQAIAILQPKLSVRATTNNLNRVMEKLHGVIWKAINTVRKADKLADARAALKELHDSEKVAVEAVINGLFKPMLEGTAVIPEEAKDEIQQAQLKAASEIRGSAGDSFLQVRYLLEAIFTSRSSADFDSHLNDITRAYERTRQKLHDGVIHTVSILRKLLDA